MSEALIDPEQDAGSDVEEPAGPELPEKFGGDVGKLVTSYGHLERKLSEQGSELATLRAQLAEFEAMTALSPDEYEPLWDERDGQPQPQDFLEPRERLAALAQAAAAAYDQAIGAAPQPPSAEQTMAMTKEILDATAPEFEQWSEPAQQVMAARPDLHARAVEALSRGDAAEVARAWMDATSVAKANAATELHTAAAQREKMAAQTMSGTGDRSPRQSSDEAEWSAIKKAGENQYWQGSS